MGRLGDSDIGFINAWERRKDNEPTWISVDATRYQFLPRVLSSESLRNHPGSQARIPEVCRIPLGIAVALNTDESIDNPTPIHNSPALSLSRRCAESNDTTF